MDGRADDAPSAPNAPGAASVSAAPTEEHRAPIAPTEEHRAPIEVPEARIRDANCSAKKAACGRVHRTALSWVLAIAPAVMFLLFLPFVVVISSIKSWLVRPILRRHDLLLLAMIDVCATTHRRRDAWFADTARTEVVRAIEAAARTAEAAFRTGFIPSTRHLVRNDALRLAAVIRQHKKPILRATGPSAFDRVTESMWSGVVALIEDDWAALTAAAPPVTAATKLRRFVSRTGPQAVLLGAAFAIPLIPAVAEEPAVASSVRVTLIVTAILGLALPRESSARAPILDVLGKALPFKPEK